MEQSKQVGVVTVRFELTERLVDDLITTAMEGGINYWCSKIDRRPKAPDYACVLTDDDGKEHVFNIDKLVAGLAAVALKRPNRWAAFVDEITDAEDADVIIQTAVFGDVVYG